MQSHLILSGSSLPELARGIAAELAAPLGNAEITSFPDGELCVRVPESVRNEHGVIVQSTCAPIERHLLELCLLSDACRRSGARQVTALIPYFGYARQDRRTHAGDAIALRVVTVPTPQARRCRSSGRHWSLCWRTRFVRCTAALRLGRLAR
jgi:ribose-phosphate pyrophosphokinase